jgi:xanthosine utilization system XapX-like protein
MSIKTKALLQAIAAVALIIGTVVGTTYLLSLLSPDAPAIFSIGLLLGVFLYMTYSLILSRLESKEILDKLNSNK